MLFNTENNRKLIYIFLILSLLRFNLINSFLESGIAGDSSRLSGSGISWITSENFTFVAVFSCVISFSSGSGSSWIASNDSSTDSLTLIWTLKSLLIPVYFAIFFCIVRDKNQFLKDSTQFGFSSEIVRLRLFFLRWWRRSSPVTSEPLKTWFSFAISSLFITVMSPCTPTVQLSAKKP